MNEASSLAAQTRCSGTKEAYVRDSIRVWGRVQQEHQGPPEAEASLGYGPVQAGYAPRDARGREELEEFFAYIQKYWKHSAEDLKEEPFDLEACFTLLQQQRLEADADGDSRREEEVARVEDQLSSLLLARALRFSQASATGTARGYWRRRYAARATCDGA